MQLQTYCDPLAILPRKMNRGAADGGAFKFALLLVAGYYAWCRTNPNPNPNPTPDPSWP